MTDRLSLENIDVPSDEGFAQIETADERRSFGVYQLVGHGSKTNDNCGRFSSFYGCIRIELHDRITLDGHDHRGKVDVHKVFNSCDKPSCPLCYKYGWASRESHKIEVRIAEGSKRFGEAEHLVATAPQQFYGLDDEHLRMKIIEVLRACGVIGGTLIFHGFRYNKHQCWYWSPHFHVLGFIRGGYVCRNCKKKCFRGCGKFNDVQYRVFEKYGCIVKVAEDKFGVKGKRDSIGGTAWYQLNHATIRTDVKRPHCVTWFGVCSYRKLKVKVEKRKVLCRICQNECVKLLYFGSKNFVMDRNSPYFERRSFEDLKEDGREVWFEDTRHTGWASGSGSYEGKGVD